MSDIIKNLVIWTVVLVVIMSLFSGISGRNNAANEYNYTEFMQQVDYVRVHYMFSRILNFLFVIVFFEKKMSLIRITVIMAFFQSILILKMKIQF